MRNRVGTGNGGECPLRVGALAVLVLTALFALGLPPRPAAAAPAPTPPPPGPVNGSGNFEGTEAVLDEGLIDTTCFFRNTRSVFALRGVGTFAAKTAGGAPVAYKAEIGPNQSLYADGPVQIEVESTATYFHGPGGTFGTNQANCNSANYGSAVPAITRLFAPDHLYRLDGGGAQVPCGGTGSFYRYGGSWHADWSLDADCTVVGNAAGTPGTGTARQGSLFTNDGYHSPCSDVCTSNIGFDAKEYLAIPGSGVTLVGSTDSAQVADNVTATARVTNDGVAQSGVTVTFTVAGPGSTTPPSGSALTGADGRATFSFTASVVGDYTVTATAPSATNPPQTITATLAVEFTPPDPPTIVISGPTTGFTEENTTFSALFTDARVPVAGSTIDFSVTGAGTATPATGSAVTGANGKASFSFAGARAGDYTVAASATYNAATVTETHDVALTINTFYRARGVTAASGENNFTSAVIDPAANYGYFGTSTSPAQVVKVDLGTMTRVGAVTLNSGENNLTSAVIDPAGAYAYFGTNTNPGRVVKIDLTTFTRVGAITLATGEGGLKSAVIHPSGNYAYFGTAVSTTAAGRVVKIDLSTFTRVGAITFASDETQLAAAVMAPGGGFAYFAAHGLSNSGTGRLVKVDLSTFTRVGAAALIGTLERSPTSAVIDPAGNFAYLGTNSYPSVVIKVDLGTFARVGALTIDGYAGEDEDGPFLYEASLYSAVMAPDGGRAYFGTSAGTSPSPRQIIEIDLATLTRARTVTLPTGEGNLSSAVIASDGANAYFGTAASPGQVVKIALRRPPSPALVAAADSYTTPYAAPLTVPAPGVLANDIDTGDADPLVAAQASDPAGGSVVMNADGSFTYTPDVGFAGTDTFTYTASDNVDYSAPATVSVAVGMAPEEISDVFGGALGFFTNVGLFGGPIEPRGPAPTVSLPRVGGDLSATDPDGDTGIYGPAYIFENHGPLEVHTTGTPGPGGSVTSSSTVYNVEDNDPFRAASPDGVVFSTCSADSSGVSGYSNIVNGTLVLHTDVNTQLPTETVTLDHDYYPAPNTEYSGALDHVGDHWRIILNEQITGPDSITVNAVHMFLLGPIARGEMIIGQSRCGVRAAAPNAAPVAGADSYATNRDTALAVAGPGVLANDTDADGQPLSAAKLTPVFPATVDGDWTFASDPDHGTLVLNSDGSFTYTPDAGYVGADSFTYLAADPRGYTDVATVALNVNAPPVAADDAYGTTADAPFTVADPGVLGNDTDADGGTLSAASPSDPPHGAVTLNADGSFTYTPDAAYVGADSFTYTASDGQGGTDTATVSIAVTAVNHAPVATDDSYSVTEDLALSLAAPAVLANDTDADANPLTAGAPTDPPHGSIALAANGSFTYTPDANYNGPDSFDYTASDGQGGTDTATVAFTITAVNDAPAAGDDTYATDEDVPLVMAAPGVLGNDSDVESPTLSAGSASDPPHGSVTLSTDGAFTYTPDAHYNGPDSFGYTTSDGTGGTDTAVVTITVVSVPDAPTAGADSYSGYNGTPLNVAAPGVLANDSDGDSDPLTAGAPSDPPGGSVTLNANGSFTYNADAAFTGTDTFTYTVSDGTGRTGIGTVTITVLPGQASLLKDLNPGPGFSAPWKFVQMGDAVYFVSNFSVPSGLWRTDGTEAGTVLVKDLDIDIGDELTAMGDRLFFVADEGVNGFELWTSDGTTAGTTLVKDINPGVASSYPQGLAGIGGTLFFRAYDDAHGVELWTSDGTAAGTTFVKDTRPGSAHGEPQRFVGVGGVVVFVTNDGVHGIEPWRTDGTEAGTVLLKDVNPGTANSNSSLGFGFTAFGDTVLFSATDGTTAGAHGSELWKTDGTAAGTVVVKDIVPGTGGSGPRRFTVVGNSVVFSADDGAGGHGTELWKTDGTEAGTVLYADVRPGTASSSPDWITAFGNGVLFSASDGTATGFHGTELWKSDGTAAGTALVKDINPVLRTGINPGTQDSSPEELVVFAGSAYFKAVDGTHGRELWKTDGTQAGTVLVQDINPGPADSLSPSIYARVTPSLGTIFFVANDGIHGSEEPFRLTPASTNPALVAIDDAYSTDEGVPLTAAAPGVLGNDTGPGGPLSAIQVGNPVHGSVALNANGSFVYTPAASYTGADSFSYRASDGTSMSNLATVSLTVVPARASLLKDLTPGSGGGYIGGFYQMGDAVYFLDPFSVPSGLWKTDGTEAGTVLVKSLDLTDGNADMTLMDNHLYFDADDGIHGPELWKTDGTEAGTVMVRDINPGLPDYGPYMLAAVGGTLYFDTDDGTHGHELWKSDGTTEGTTLVKDIRPGTASSDPSNFVAVGNTVVFVATDGTTTGFHGKELWATDGTEAGTVLFEDINPGTASGINSAGLEFFTTFGGSVLFPADDGTHGRELWKTDGTEAGTSLFKDIRPGTGTSSPGDLAVAGDMVLFHANASSTQGPELWKTDGTEAGTVLVKDINTRSGSGSNLDEFTVLGDTVLFRATDGTTTGFHGLELWKTDGTEAGTVMVKDINPVLRTATNPGTSDSRPADLVLFGGSVYFWADDGTHGGELWKTDGSTPGTVLVQDINPGTANAFPDNLSPALGTLFFLANDGIHGDEPWRLAPGPPPPPAVSASPSTVTAGGSVTATWSDIASPTAIDWVGLYSSSTAAEPELLTWAYTDGSPAGSQDLPVPAGAPPGTTYELRLFSNNSYARIATSAPFSVVASATAISASPSSVNPGAPVTATWSGIAAPTATDWVGLYDSSSAPEPALLNWAYTNGTAGGSLTLFVPGSAPLGATYELRLFTNNSYTRIATSASFSVVASTATISASSSMANPGAPLTATWGGIGAPSATDWVGLYDSSSTPNPGLLAWTYTNGTAAGSLTLFVPSGAPLGTAYELRLFTNNSYTRLATSAPFTVAVSNASISASPSSVAAGSPVTATWSGIAGPTATDWVGLYASSGAADPAIVAWAYTGGAAAGSLNLTVPAGSPPATTYELRLYSNNSYTRLATSAPFSVS